MTEQKAAEFLWNCAKELTTQTHAEWLLKSHYINTCRKLVKHNAQLPEDIIGPARMCSRCGNQWADGKYQLQLQPQRLANNAKRRRQIAQLDAMKAKQERGTLSRGAQKRAKWLKKRMASNIAVDCKLCRHKTMLPLEKPKKRIKSASNETIATTKTTRKAQATAAPAAIKKKKNKNKDLSVGQKLPIPLKQQQNTLIAQSSGQTTAKTPTRTATIGASKAQSNKQKPKSKAAQFKSAATTPAPKVQSKTQKQNALLQLAAQLKSHATKNAGKTQQSRLQAFLK